MGPKRMSLRDMRTTLRLVSLARAPVFATLFAFTPKLVREARIQAD